jgi:hypothetical protein
VTAAHRRVILRNHPDRGGAPFLATKINEAKEVCGDCVVLFHSYIPSLYVVFVFDDVLKIHIYVCRRNISYGFLFTLNVYSILIT